MGNTHKLFPVQTAEPLNGGSGHVVGGSWLRRSRKRTANSQCEVSAHLPCSRRCTGCTQKCCNSWRVRQSSPGTAHVLEAGFSCEQSETRCCVPRCSTETPEAHMIRWSKLLHNCRGKHKILHGEETYFESSFASCGHVARLTKTDLQRETSRIFMLKSMEWLRNLKKEFIPMSWTPVQGCGVGGGRCAVCWHRFGERVRGSEGVVGQDRCDDQVEKTRNGGSKCQPIE